MIRGPEEGVLKKIVGRVALALLIALVVVYAVDWAVWRVRVARGGGMGAVQVSYFQVANLKNGGAQYYPDGAGAVSCSQSIFPQGGANPCWYVVQHPVVFEK